MKTLSLIIASAALAVGSHAETNEIPLYKASLSEPWAVSIGTEARYINSSIGAKPSSGSASPYSEFNAKLFPSVSLTDWSASPYIRLTHLVKDFDSTLKLSGFAQYNFSESNISGSHSERVINIESPSSTFESEADLKSDIHTLTLGLNAQKDIGSRFHLFVDVGPTLSIINTDISTSQSFNKSVYYSSARNSTNARLGVLMQGGLNVDIDAAKRWSADVHAGYNWINSLNITDSSGYQGKINPGTPVIGGVITFHF